MLIDKGLYEYGYFNACFLENMMSLMVYALSKGYTPYIDLKDRGKVELIGQRSSSNLFPLTPIAV